MYALFSPLPVRTVLLALIGFMPTEGGGAIGSLDMPAAERRRLAQCSQEWVCPVCGVANKDILPPLEARQEGEKDSHDKVLAEAADIVSQMAFKVCSRQGELRDLAHWSYAVDPR